MKTIFELIKTIFKISIYYLTKPKKGSMENVNPNQIGITQLLEAQTFLIKVANTTDDIAEDKKVTGDEAVKIIGLYPDALKAWAGKEQIPAEIADMDVEEAEQFKQAFYDLNLRNDKIEHLSEVSLQAIVDIGQALKRVVQAFKEAKE